MHGWRTWLSDLQQLLVHGDDAVLVTIARTEGATPREVGVKMVVARDRTFHTIGGGALEWRTIEFARRLLRDGAHAGGLHGGYRTSGTQCVTRRLERISLGEYGDAPPGAATIAFERLTIADLAWVTLLSKRLAADDTSVRTVSFADDSPVLLSDALPNANHADCLLWDAGPMMTETLVREAFPVMVFGAGHVGTALIRVLATLPCEIFWVDDRPAQLLARAGDALPANVRTIASDDPPSCVAQAPDGCNFVVMTYSDTLDQHIVESVLQSNRFDYLGVIGSHTKRHTLEQVLHARGIAPIQLARLHCPIGLDAMPSNAPEIIAVSVAAQLLQHRARVGQPDAPHAHANLRGSGHGNPYDVPDRRHQAPMQDRMHDPMRQNDFTAHARGSHVENLHPVSTRLPDGTTVTTITTVTTSAPAAPSAAHATDDIYPTSSTGTSPGAASAPAQGQTSAVSPAYADWKPR